MADFAAVLRKTIDGLQDNTPEMRRKIYDKARATIEAKLAAIDPPPPAALAERQRKALEEAIQAVEADHIPARVSEPEAQDGLDRVLADLDPNTVRPAPSVAAPLVDGGQGKPPDRAPLPPEPAVLGPEHEGMEVEADEAPAGGDAPAPAPRRRRRYGALVAALVVLVLAAGAAYGLWLNRDALADLPGFDRIAALVEGISQKAQSPQTESGKPAGEGEQAQPETQGKAAVQEPAAGERTDTGPQKFTQRLTSDGGEIDEGPAGEESSIGEGTSVAAATEPPPGEAAGEEEAPPAEAGNQQIPVAQKAIFYEERTNASQGSSNAGTVVWSLVQESPGDDQPPEPAIRAEAKIPDKNLQLRLTIRRNADKSLPASHIVEMIFLTPDDFPGGGIDNVLRIAMKQSEQDTGNPLLGIPAKIADGFFLFALNDSKAEEQANLLLLRRQQWIDIPIVYKSGRRALITMEKGLPGERVFEQALQAWSKETSG